MCGRFSLFAPPHRIEERFQAAFDYPYERRYNATPGQFLPVVTDERPDRIATVRWGLVPTWADDDEHAPINARAETLSETPSFQASFRGAETGLTAHDGTETAGQTAGRCLVLADGFYEWTETDDGTTPYRITRVDDEPFAMAGLWTRWRDPVTQTGLSEFGAGTGEETDSANPFVETFAIVTTDANETIAPLHDRMPVVLSSADERRWLSADPASASELLAPAPDDELRTYPVSRAVNDPTNDSRAVVTERNVPD